MERTSALFRFGALLFFVLLPPSRIVSAADPFLLELEPLPKGYWGAIDLNGWLTVPEPIRSVHLSLKLQRSLVAQVSALVPCPFSASELPTQSPLADTSAEVDIASPIDP